MTTATNMSAHDRRVQVHRRVLITLTLTVAMLAIGAFTLSFDALKALAVTAGLNAQLAWLWPLIVDGFIVLATATAVMLRDRGWRVSWYPWATLIVFAAVSVAGNALHAASHADLGAMSVTVAALVSAVPAVALLLASHLLVVLLSPHPTGIVNTDHRPAVAQRDRKATTNNQPTPTAVKVHANVTTAPPPPDRRALTAAAREQRSALATATIERPVIMDADQLSAIKKWAEQQKSAGAPITGETLGAHFGFSAATGRRRLRELRQTGQLPTE